MGLKKRLSDQRRQLIEGRARPHLHDDEEVVHWVRARRVKDRGEGFLFITARRFVFHWDDSEDGYHTATWEEVETWAIVRHSKGGPILGVETPGEKVLAQVATRTQGQVESARLFIQHFADHAPDPVRAFSGDKRFGSWETDPDVTVSREKKTPIDHTKRIALSVLGVALIVTALIIIPLPGPWSFILTIGGLAVLAREYDWAKDLLEWTKDRFEAAKKKIRGRKKRTDG